MFIDMHLHSNYSDGKDSVPTLVEKLIAAKVSVFSLTDHDSISGIPELLSCTSRRATAIPGVEFSCKDEKKRCHILAYGFDPNDQYIRKLVEKGADLRRKNFENRKKHLEEVHGIFFTESELAWLLSLPEIGKPHIAAILIERGLASNTNEAIHRYLDGCKSGSFKLQANEAISGILAAGAIPVWAHPLGGEGEKHLNEEEFLSLANKLISYGIKGMECYYSRYTKEEIAFLLQKADDFHLAVSGGSDYHGTNKTVMLGELQAGECFTVTPDMLSVLQLF